MTLQRRIKRTLCSALAVTLVVTLAACSAPAEEAKEGPNAFCPTPGPPTEPGQPNADISGSIVVSGWNNAAPKAVMDQFKQAYPNISVKFEDIGASDYLPKLLTALRAGTGAPDISFLQDSDAPEVWKMPVADLTTCMKANLKDFPDYKVKNISRPDGTIQAVPWEAGPVQLMYRRDTFEKYGIDAASLTTWEAYIAAGKKLVQDSNGAAHMMMSNQTPPPSGLESMTQDFVGLTQQNGGNFFDAEGNPTFKDPKVVEALELVKKFRDEGITLNDVASDQAGYDPLKSGAVASWIAPTWWKYYPQTFAKDTAGKWGGVPLPAFAEGGARSTNLGGTSLVIPSQTKNGVAAWTFLNFWLMRVESRKLSFEDGGGLFENIYAPAANDPLFTAPDKFFGGDPWLANAAKLAPEIPKLNRTAKSTKIPDEMTLLWPKFLDGSKDATTTLNDLENAVMAR